MKITNEQKIIAFVIESLVGAASWDDRGMIGKGVNERLMELAHEEAKKLPKNFNVKSMIIWKNFLKEVNRK